MARVIAVANLKGGVGKTVTSINLAASLAERGRRVLLIDLDPQGHCGLGLGVDVDARVQTTRDVLRGPPGVWRQALCTPVPTLPTLALIPSNLELALVEQDVLGAGPLPNLALSHALKDARAEFDEIVLDCPPSLAKLSINAFLASDLVIIPVAVGYFSLHGLRMLAEALGDISDATGLDFDIRCLLTRYRSGQRTSQELRTEAERVFGEFRFRTIIHETIEVERSIGAGEPALVYNPRSTAAQDYAALAQELLGSAVSLPSVTSSPGTKFPLAPPAGAELSSATQRRPYG